jgi:hypothetical protein
MPLILGIVASGNYPRATSSYESISTVTVGAGGSSSISFTSIPSTYKHLQIRGIARNTSAGTSINGIFTQFNSDTGANYSRHNLIGDGASATASASTSSSNVLAGQYPQGGTTANVFGVFVLDILEYGNTNINKTTRALFGTDLNGSGQLRLSSGNWRSTSAITSITITPEDANFAQYSQFALYGIKG